MKDMRARVAKLQADAADCRLISDQTTDAEKRELFARLAEHLNALAREVSEALAKAEVQADSRNPPAERL